MKHACREKQKIAAANAMRDAVDFHDRLAFDHVRRLFQFRMRVRDGAFMLFDIAIDHLHELRAVDAWRDKPMISGATVARRAVGGHVFRAQHVFH